VPACHHDGIKVLDPPIITCGSRFPQRHLPLVANLHDVFDRSVVGDKIAVPIPIQELLDVPSHDVPVPEGGIEAVKRDRRRAPFIRDGFLAELHRQIVNIRLEVGID